MDLDDAPAAALAPVVASGDYQRSLEALRDSLAESIDGLSPRQVIHKAPLSKQLAEVLKTLEELTSRDGSDDFQKLMDELSSTVRHP